jgi:uncharacterized protein YbaR (Trm112 family)
MANGGPIAFCRICHGKLTSIIKMDEEARENYCPRCKKMYPREEIDE